MANPNPQFYRTPENWIECKILSGTAAGVNRPKIVDWDGDSANYRTGVLSHGVDNGYFEFAEPLDITLCPTGQHPSVSCFSEIWRFQNPQTDTAAATPTEIIERKNAPCNWTFGEVLALGGSLFGAIRDKSSPLQRWSPNTANDQGKNTNWNFSPFVTWGVRGALLQIRVMTITSYDNYNGVLIPHYNDNNLMSLDDWKNSHNTEPLQGIDFVFYGNTGESNDTITYATSWIYNDGTGVGACSIDQCGEYNSEPFYDYTRGFFNRENFLGLLPAGLNENYNDTADSVYFCGLDKLQGAEIRGVANPSNGWRLGAVVPYSDANYNAIIQMAACFAMAFTPTSKNTFTLTDNDYYLPIIRDNGISYGEYTHGAANETNTTAQISDIRTVNYDPEAYIDPNTYSNTTVFNVINAGASMNKRYLLDAANVGKLATDLFTICDNMKLGDDYSFFDSKVKANMLTQSPIDCIVSLIRYPFTPTHGNTKQTVKLGRFDASAEGYPISNAIQTITFTGKKIFPRFGNCFLDYEPYTKYEVYVPFCDTVEISAADILGHTLNVRLIVDLYTGVCTGYILADSLCIETTTGNVGVNLPLTGLDTATINANIANAESNKKAAKKNYFKGHFDIITQKDKVGAFWNQVLGTNEDIVKKADYDLKHIETPMHTIGAASPLTSWAMDLNARIMIYYPTGDAVTDTQPPSLKDLSTYAHTTGFATIDNAVLSNYTGFTVATNAILNFAATTTEKEMIENMLNGGVFI